MTSVLVIDDDTETRLIARRVLESAGFAVSTAADDRAIARHFDLVIADLAVISPACLRRQYPKARILAVSRTGHAELTKPFTPSQLLAAVRLCLARR